MDDMTKLNMIFGFIMVFGLLILFLALKLTSVIAWSWWWVFAPLWIPFVLGFILSFFGFKPPME